MFLFFGIKGPIVQLVEFPAHNGTVVGSSPIRPIL